MNDIASAGGANRVFAQAGWITSSQNEAARACGIPRFVDKARPKVIIMALLSQNLLIFSVLFILGGKQKIPFRGTIMFVPTSYQMEDFLSTHSALLRVDTEWRF